MGTVSEGADGLLLAAELRCVCQKLSGSNNVTFIAEMMVRDVARLLLLLKDEFTFNMIFLCEGFLI